MWFFPDGLRCDVKLSYNYMVIKSTAYDMFNVLNDK